MDDPNNIIRQTISQDPINPKDHLDSGYEESPSLDFTIPSCGIRDVDEAMFRLFDKDIGFIVDRLASSNKERNPRKPFVIFAAGERFAMAKKLKPPRSKQGNLILPAIAIRKVGMTQNYDDMISRGINQTTGNLVIKRKLSSEFDRDYQGLINKLAMQNMISPPSSTRQVGEFGPDRYKGTLEGGILEPHLGNNVWEIITIPQPQFYTMSYEVTFWTDKMINMNEMIEKVMSSYLPQDKTFKLVTPKGYWFVAYVKEMSAENNFDDFSEEERTIRYTFNMDVKAFLLAPQGDTDKVPVRRWISSPNIVFDVHSYNSSITTKEKAEALEKQNSGDLFTLTDLNVDPKEVQNPTTLEKLRSRKIYMNPDGSKHGKYVKIIETNEKQGETIYRASDIKTLEKYILNQ